MLFISIFYLLTNNNTNNTNLFNILQIYLNVY